MKKLTLAMPQLIPQSKLNPDYVEGWRKYAASALKNANLTPIIQYCRGLVHLPRWNHH